MSEATPFLLRQKAREARDPFSAWCRGVELLNKRWEERGGEKGQKGGGGRGPAGTREDTAATVEVNDEDSDDNTQRECVPICSGLQKTPPSQGLGSFTLTLHCHTWRLWVLLSFSQALNYESWIECKGIQCYFLACETFPWAFPTISARLIEIEKLVLQSVLLLPTHSIW